MAVRLLGGPQNACLRVPGAAQSSTQDSFPRHPATAGAAHARWPTMRRRPWDGGAPRARSGTLGRVRDCRHSRDGVRVQRNARAGGESLASADIVAQSSQSGWRGKGFVG